MKNTLAVREDFNLIDAFGVLDVFGRGYISATELRESLLDLGLKCSIDEVHLVFEKLNTLNDG